MNKKGFTLVEFVVSVTIIFVLAAIIFAVMGFRYSSKGVGNHNGFITAIDQRGFIFKNYDVYFKTDNSSSQEDLYCINRFDEALVKKAQEANKEKKQVVLTYKGVRGIGLGLCGYEQITNIEYTE